MKSAHVDKWIAECVAVGAKLKVAKDNQEGVTFTAQETQTLIKMLRLLNGPK